MSVVAWDGKTLAADCQQNWSDVPLRGSKVFEHDGVLFGHVGSAEDGAAFEEWVKAGSPEETKPELEDVNFLSVSKGQLYWASERLVWLRVNATYFAIGAGRDVALGAMAAGMSAPQAVKIACQHNIHCGIDIETLSLEVQK